ATGAADFAGRSRRIAGIAAARREAVSARRRQVAAEHRMTRAWLNHCLNEVAPRDAIVVNEYWVDRELFDRELAGSYFATPPAGGLGWGLPAALGMSQAARDRVVIAAVGDGAYLFANPAACHQAAAAHALPVLTIVCNNRRWAAVEWAAVGLYPQGHAARQGTPAPLSSLAPTPDFELYARASGGHGETVSDAAELPGALRRALDVVRGERRQALVNVLCE
ncbi:MAG: thiamine pyrophosphate-dependent enzyme, partial [Steroidobacteraceae bacterium]